MRGGSSPVANVDVVVAIDEVVAAPAPASASSPSSSSWDRGIDGVVAHGRWQPTSTCYHRTIEEAGETGQLPQLGSSCLVCLGVAILSQRAHHNTQRQLASGNPPRRAIGNNSKTRQRTVRSDRQLNLLGASDRAHATISILFASND